MPAVSPFDLEDPLTFGYAGGEVARLVGSRAGQSVVTKEQWRTCARESLGKKNLSDRLGELTASLLVSALIAIGVTFVVMLVSQGLSGVDELATELLKT